jgi:integrase
VQEYTDGGHYLDFISVKTQADNLIPISEEAYMLLGEKKDGLIFEGLKKEMTNHPLKDWISSAGIKKHITFHCFRHTYASLQIEMGTDAFTVQKLLAHKTIGTTEIYTRHADPKRREAANKICLGLLKPKVIPIDGEKKKRGRPRKQVPNN